MKISPKSTVNFEVTLTLSEDEARALTGLAGYGIDNFISVFYKEMGKHYLQPYEKGLRRLFEHVRVDIVPELRLVDKAREALAGQLKGLNGPECDHGH